MSRGVAKNAFILSLFTLSSRILGYVRDSINAALFGAGFVSDAYYVAFRIPNFLRDLVAEGSFSSAFVSVFSNILEKNGKRDAWRLANLVLNLLVFILIFIVVLGVVFSPFIVKVLGWGFSAVPNKLELTVKLTRILFPFIAFISLASFFMGILNSFGNFSLPAFAPCLFNIAMILSGFYLCPLYGPDPEKQIIGWTIGALVGSFLQLVVQMPNVFKLGFKYNFIINIFHPLIKKIVELLIPGVLGLSVVQINLFVNILIASLLTQGSVTYLNYGNRLMQFPLALFGISIATVILPTLSASIARNNLNEAKQIFNDAIRLVFYFILPSSVGICVLSQPINDLLFGYGKFNSVDVNNTALVSTLFSIGLFAIAANRVFVAAFYSFYDTWTPLKIGLISVLANIFLNIYFKVFEKELNFCGPPIATTLASILSFFMYLYYLKKKFNFVANKELFSAFNKILLAALIMGIVLYVGYGYSDLIFKNTHRLFKILRLFLVMFVGVLSYFTCSFFLKIKEQREFFSVFLKI